MVKKGFTYQQPEFLQLLQNCQSWGSLCLSDIDARWCGTSEDVMLKCMRVCGVEYPPWFWSSYKYEEKTFI